MLLNNKTECAGLLCWFLFKIAIPLSSVVANRVFQIMCFVYISVDTPRAKFDYSAVLRLRRVTSLFWKTIILIILAEIKWIGIQIPYKSALIVSAPNRNCVVQTFQRITIRLKNENYSENGSENLNGKVELN